ncbi:MAG TPA: glycosyltransferase family 39 protein [Myxococcota bacterium]|nr:glycosyltransferase family 39 protein [Myxococcota bacterium]
MSEARAHPSAPPAQGAAAAPVAAARAVRRRDVALLLALAALLVLPNLGGPRLWSDEGDTAVFARTILARGLPYAWDGRTFTESDRGRRLNEDLLMVGTPWLPYYATAASFAALGESAFSARLPFALCAVAAVALLYLLVADLTRDRRAALAAALLLLASVQFLLFARQSRHYAPNALGTLAVLWGFARLRVRPRSPVFAASSILLFHVHPLPAAATLAGSAFAALVHPDFARARRPLLAWSGAIALGTLPWLAIAWTGWEENSSALARAGELPVRLAQAGVEAAEAVPLLGWLALFLAGRRRLARGDGAFLALALPCIAAFVALLALALSVGELFALGLRYAVGVLPLAAGVTGVLAVRAAGASRWRLAALLALFAATHVPGATALYLTLARDSARDQTGVLFHEPRGALGPWLRVEWLGYPRELVESDPGTVSHVVAYLAEHAEPEDILVTNYEWEPLYFHTRLPQGYKVLPDYDLYEAARAHGLPDHAFDAGAARWVVWRPPAEGYQGYRFADVRAAVESRGRRLEPVATVPETLWENRPELHFHRFPGVRYLYPVDVLRSGYGHGGPARIYRVEAGAPSPSPSP